jgi:HEAT repeat protein
MRFPAIDVLSFWIGFGSAALIAFLLFRFRRQLGAGRQAIYDRLRRVREFFTSGAERNLRQDVHRWAQTSHLAGTLFALDDILLPPRLLAPEPPVDPTRPPPEEDVSVVIPVLPDWPDLAAIYHAPTISPEDALSGSGHVLILGQPGHGKSTLLAHLATRVATDGDSVFGEATPILIHAGDLDVPHTGDVVQPLIAAAQARASALIGPQLPRHLRLRLREFKCVIFLDGLDELTPTQIADVAAWLAAFQKAYPKQRFVAAAGFWGYGPLLPLGFAPIALAPWSADDYRALIEKWGAAWQKTVLARRKKSAPPDVDPHIVMGWLGNNNTGRSIFEVTLKIWEALAGDTRGNRPTDWMETLILRAGVAPLGQKALGKLAAQMFSQEVALGLPRGEVKALLDPVFAGPDGKPQAAARSDDFLDGLIGKRLLVRRAKDRVSFRHSLVGAYCAARAVADDPAGLTPGSSPAWARALYFFAALGDLTPLVGQRLTQAPDLAQTELFAAARWLRDTPASAKWRGEVFRRLSRVLLDPAQPEALRLRALTAFVWAGDPSLPALFKQMLANPDPFARRMGALAMGTILDPALVPQLAPLFSDPYLDVRWAAALALGAMGTQPAFDLLQQGLAQGDDALRRACAQAMARNLELGHPILQEAIVHPDLSVRRAAVYGLLDTHTLWARRKLEEMQHNEQEWFVRSAATEALNKLDEPPSDRAPQPYPQPESQGWLVAWAAAKGTGVPPGKAAIEVLNRALKEGDEATRLAAAEAIGRLADPALTRELYPVLRDSSPLLRDVAFRALARASSASAQRLAAG